MKNPTSRQLFMRKQIGAKFRNERLKLKMNQSQFAEKIGVLQHFVSKIESGENNITVDTITLFCDGLGIDFAGLWK